jgi:hypothetical protein
MKEKILKIPKKLVINDSLPIYVSKKIMKVKMSDITTTEEFSVNIKGRSVIIKHSNERELKKFSSRLNKLIKDGGNKLGKIML